MELPHPYLSRELSKLVKSPEERARIDAFRRKVDFYRDNVRPWLEREIAVAFKSAEVREGLRPFIGMACGPSFFSRIIDEVSKHTYNPAPTRVVTPSKAATAYGLLADEIGLDAKFDLAVRLCQAANHSFLHPRYIPGQDRATLRIYTPDELTAVIDPEDATRAEAFVIHLGTRRMKGHSDPVKCYRYWSSTQTFDFAEDGSVISAILPNETGVIPIVELARREKSGGFWDMRSGSDLESAQLSISMLSVLRLKLHKSQGETQVVITGDTAGMSFPQVIDAEHPFIAQEGTSVSTLDLKSSASHYTESIQHIETGAAASRGVSRARLNAEHTGVADDTPLQEQRAETIRGAAKAEKQLFEMLKPISANYTDKARHIPEKAKLRIDYHEIEARLDSPQRLAIWEGKMKLGLKKPTDMVMAEQPEIRTHEEAKAEILDNLEEWGWLVEMRRKLNASDEEIMGQEEGQSPQENGADNDHKGGPEDDVENMGGTPGDI